MGEADPSPARDASTIILLREREEDFAVFMVKRHARSGFMANAYVYPGGRVDAADASPSLAARSVGLDGAGCCARLEEPELEEAASRALFLAGIRESFEEAGVLLARHRGADALVALDASDPETNARFETHREALNAGELTLEGLAEAEDLEFPLDRLRVFARWITPVVEPRRYDTRFFVAVAPRRQELSHDERETVDSLWRSPRELLEDYAAGAMQLAPPTLCTLEELAELGTVEAVLRRCEEGAVAPIMPHFAERDGALVLLLPNHPEHPDEDTAYEGPSHVVLSDGRWWSR